MTDDIPAMAAALAAAIERQSAKQYTEAELKTMSPQQVNAAFEAGQCADVLAGKTPDQLQRKERERRAQEVARANLRHLIDDGSK